MPYSTLIITNMTAVNRRVMGRMHNHFYGMFDGLGVLPLQSVALGDTALRIPTMLRPVVVAFQNIRGSRLFLSMMWLEMAVSFHVSPQPIKPTTIFIIVNGSRCPSDPPQFNAPASRARIVLSCMAMPPLFHSDALTDDQCSRGCRSTK